MGGGVDASLHPPRLAHAARHVPVLLSGWNVAWIERVDLCIG